MKRILSSMFLAALMLAVATGAHAANFAIIGGAAGTIPGGGSNVFLQSGALLDPLTTVSGYYGSQINYSVVGIGTITIDFYGGEAGFNDQFQYLGVTPTDFTHSGTPVNDPSLTLGSPKATFSTSITGSGLVPFQYLINSVAGPVNGSNQLNTLAGPANFFSACDPLVAVGATPTSCNTVWLFLDDNGNNNDDNHDDYLVRLRIEDPPPTVPEPTSFALLGSGIIGLGLIARKVRK